MPQPAATVRIDPDASIAGAATVVGVIDQDWTIEQISVDDGCVFHLPATALLGSSLLHQIHPADLAGLVTRVAAIGEDLTSLTTNLRIGAPQRWRSVRLTLTRMLGAGRAMGFVVASAGAGRADPDAAEARRSRLEEHLLQIAREVQAAGLLEEARDLPSVEAVPGAWDLSPRQREVLRRLLVGQRVPTIARDLYVSTSTVRNHLTAIFARYSVHSQAELIEAFRATRGNPSDV